MLNFTPMKYEPLIVSLNVPDRELWFSYVVYPMPKLMALPYGDVTAGLIAKLRNKA